MDRPKVLVIDDDPNLRRTLSDILNAKGYEPLAAKNGIEGLEILKSRQANVALVDLQMPGISGLEVLSSIRSGYPSTEVIILTGNATLDSAIEATNKGAFSYMQKPYEIDQLLLHIKRAVEKQTAEEEVNRRDLELQRINSELKALYEVSLAVNWTNDLDELFTDVLLAVTGMECFGIERKGAIFLAEDDRLRLVSSIGFSEDKRRQCGNLGFGDCLCGIAAVSGEVILSNNSQKDARHTNNHDQSPHGNIIVPLKTDGQVVGVLSIYTMPDIDVRNELKMQFITIGGQLGMAIEKSRLYEEAKSLSLHDPLTGLANRRSLNIQAEKLFESSKRYNRPLSAIMLDIDHFKIYNDTYGHQEGDTVLVRVAETLRMLVRNADYVFRYGGEEFLILLPETSSPEAYTLAERLRAAVESGADVTISLGVCSSPCVSIEDVIKKADSALYQAKMKGRNRVEEAPGEQQKGKCA